MNSDNKFLSPYNLMIGGAIIVGAYAIWCGFSYYTRASVEKLGCQVVNKIQGKSSKQTVQIRKYNNFLIAQATYDNIEMKTAMNNGFRDIAGFIFGKNKARGKEEPQKIAMTAPVTIKQTQNSGYTIAFVMPSKYTASTLPVPNNSHVKIKQMPSQKMACISWRGNIPTPELVRNKEHELRNILKQSNYTAKGEVYLYEYDPPFTPGWMRINQVLVAVEDGN